MRRLVPVAMAGGAAGGLLLLATPSSAFARLVPWLIGLASLAVLLPRRGPGPSHPRAPCRSTSATERLVVFLRGHLRRVLRRRRRGRFARPAPGGHGRSGFGPRHHGVEEPAPRLGQRRGRRGVRRLGASALVGGGTAQCRVPGREAGWALSSCARSRPPRCASSSPAPAWAWPSTSASTPIADPVPRHGVAAARCGSAVPGRAAGAVVATPLTGRARAGWLCVATGRC
jgi:hypothetical protein